MSLSRQAIDINQAFGLVCKCLQRKVRSEAQLSRWLVEQGADEATARVALAEARTVGIVDDAACARLWSEDWQRRGYGWRVIRERLLQQGLSEAHIAQVAGLGEQKREHERAARWWARRRKLKPAATTAHGYRALRAKGYSEEVIESVLSEAKLGDGEAGDTGL